MSRRLLKSRFIASCLFSALLVVLAVCGPSLAQTVGPPAKEAPAKEAPPKDVAPKETPSKEAPPKEAPAKDAKVSPPAPAAPILPATPKNADELKAIEAQVQKVVAKVLPCTVAVQVGPSGGSGVIVSEDGYVMTAGHVVGKPGQDVVFRFADGKTAKGKTLGMYVSADAGLMKITDPGKWPFAERGTSAGLKPGTWCLATGHPLGYHPGRPPVVRLGRILRRQDGFLQTDCTLVSGDSGGPLFDLEGKIIGIHSGIGGPTSVNLHVPADTFRDNWDRLVKGDSWQDDLPGRDSNEIKASFRQIVAEASRCAVRIKCDGQDAALGTIVGPDGWVLTKASQLKGKILCRLRDDRELEARVVGVSQPFDLAMLKIEASGLPAAAWSKSQPAVGQWLAAPGPGDDPLALGVMSVPPRRIPPASGVLGITLKPDEKTEAQIEKVLPRSAAERAGMKDGDIITHVNGKPVRNSAELIATIRQYRRGDIVRLNVKRGGSTLAIAAKLSILDTPGAQKQEMQNRSGVGISERRDDFPMVLQHDTVVRPVDCGGPLVDLSGKIIGINIARGGRTETYCVPTEVLLGLMYDLMSGRSAPPDAARIAAEKKAAEEKAAAAKAAAEKAAAEKVAAEKKALEDKLAAEKTAREKAELEKKVAEERANAEKTARDKAEQEKKAAEERAAAEKTAREKAEQEKKAAEEKAAKEKAEQEKKPPENPSRNP